MKTLKKLSVMIFLVLLSVLVSCGGPDLGGGNNTTQLEEVKFSNMITSMTKGETFVVEYYTQENVVSEFVSSDTSIATVEDNKVTAISVGKFTLIATFTLGQESKEYKFDIDVVDVKYSITYEVNGGILPTDVITSYLEGEELELPVPTKEGYNFLGWYKNEVLFEETVMPAENLTLVAKWEEQQVIVPPTVSYTITLDVNSGNSLVENTITGEAGSTIELPVPTKEGYNFLGWYNGEVKFEETVMPEDNLTLFAKWEEIEVPVIEYTITLDVNGGSALAENTITGEAGSALELPIPTKEGYIFLGWSLDGVLFEETVMPEENLTLVAEWEKEVDPDLGKPFAITYELNGGAWAWTTGTVSSPADGIDSVSNLPEIFMADFYTYLFENNLLNSSKVATSIQVNNWADFSKNNGDPVALYNTTSTVKTGAADGYSELFFDSLNGYEAIGGFLGTSPYKEKYANVTKHMIQLTKIKYPTVADTAKSFKAGCGFVLDGYFYGTQGLLATSKDNYATFNALRALIPTPTVGYEGSTSSTNEYVITNGVVGNELKLVAPVREGHMFLGWYTNAELTGEKVTSVSKECTLYASWVNLNNAPVHKINYVLDGGTNPSNAPTEFTFGVGAELLKPTKEGYTFIGWTTDEAGLNLITEISVFENADVTVYANWVEGEEKIYTITYIYSEGSLPSRTPNSLDEAIEYVFTSYYNWLKPTDSYEVFKEKVINQWKVNQSQGNYKFYKQNGKDTIDETYFCNASENFEEWNAWFTVFDAQVTAANGAQNAWNSYVGILRLGQWLSNSSPTTWKDSMNQALIAATKIKDPLVTEYELGQEFDLVDLVINDGRTFLGWYDEKGNKVEKIYSNTEGNLVLTAKWSEAIPVETFEITNKIDKLLKLSQHQLTWTIGPDNATFKKVSFRSSDTSILTVSENGLIKAVNTGNAKIYVTVHANTSLNMELDIEVYVDPYIDGEFVEESYVVVNETSQLKATVVGGNQADLAWKSLNPSVATVNSDGIVTGLKEGLAEIVAYLTTNENIEFTFYVTVLNEDPSGILGLLVDSHNKNIYTKEDLLIGIKIGSDGAYYSDIVGSVSKLLFEDYVVYDTYYLSNPSNKSTLSGVDFITVHYAADMPYSASAMYNGGKNLASYNKSCNTNGTAASWHYSIGNDGIWYSQNEAYGAWHAGRNTTMTWTDSGVTTAQVGTDVYTTDVTLKNGYFYIKGVKTTVANSTSGTKLNGMGLGVKLVGDKWYLGGHQYKSDYGYIGSTGGNGNSIGMETSVREGSDLWLTWQYAAQLCAKLLIKYQLPLNRLVGHHFFSGKWCPQPMLENDLEIWYEFVELTRQQMELYKNYSNYTLSFESTSSYLKDNGRVSSLPDYPECVTYTVTYTTGSTSKTVTLSTILPGTLE